MTIRQEVRRLQSRTRNGDLIYPAPVLLTWMLIGATWHLVSMEKAV